MTPTPKLTPDAPLHQTDPNPEARRLELLAIAMYRAKHPDAPPWQDVSQLLRTMWMEHAQSKEAP